jgi:hypothetical protein
LNISAILHCLRPSIFAALKAATIDKSTRRLSAFSDVGDLFDAWLN